ncbi:MAG TPA: amidase [Ktedonobacterales bacterium]|nr:amidase [Ktedonobacterales bacterium]
MEPMSPQTDFVALLRRPAVELAGLIRSGQIRSRELVEAALSQIEAHTHLNAFTLVDAEGALAAAAAIQPGDPRPFAGVPIAIKELNSVAGQRLTMGSDIFGEFVAPTDDYVVRRLKDAGFVLIGRTSAPEFGIVPVTEPRRFGPTRNPWNPDRTPGGSSGGAAVAVAAGILPVAQGTDGGGSIRIPAACCGLVGLKPSRGRISAGPDLGDNFLATNSALTRYTADAAALLDVMAGYEVGDATWAPPPPEPFAVAAARPPRPLRIAFTTASPIGSPVDPICIQAVADAAKALESLGHSVEEATPSGWVAPELEPVFSVLYAAGIAATIRYGAFVTGRAPSPELVEALSWAFYTHGTTLSAADHIAAQTRLQAHGRRLVSFFSAYDALLTPALAQRPLPIGTINTEAPDGMAEFHKAAVFTPFTAVCNFTGQPAISLPLFHGADGLPLNVQVVAPPLGEGMLLSLAAQLEATHAWTDRRP